ncbi:ATP-binding protein [Proteus sp. NGCRVN-01]|uniref:ATP-binding protein n=1 Tax=Proteus sp. NGCRVN-01 TaxID=3380534 RepID=UPI0038714A5A
MKKHRGISKKALKKKRFKLKKKLFNAKFSTSWDVLEFLSYKSKRYKYYGIKRTRSKRVSKNSKRVYFEAPAHIDYYYNNDKNHMVMNKFLDEIKQCIINSNRRIFIDFSKTELISAAAMLSFLAEIDVLIKKSSYGVNSIAFSHPKDKKIESILKQVGFYDLLKKDKRETPEYDDVTFWKYTSGVCSEPVLASQMMSGIKQELERVKSRKLYRGFVEAMSNSVEHAYLDDDLHSEQEQTAKWWTFAGINKDKELIVVICDKGVGIPSTLPKTQGVSALREFFESIRVSLQNVRDSTYIKAAATMSETRTGQNNRGKGFSDITSVIDNIGAGNLSIFSNKGRYIYGGKHRATKEIVKDYKTSVCGTIIEWTIPLEVDDK